MSKGSFFKVPRSPVLISTGEIDLPIFYSRVNNVNFFFTADYKKVVDKVGNHGLKPGLTWRRKAVVALAFYNYQETSIGPYNEVALAIPVLKTNERPPLNGWMDLYRNLRKRKTGVYILNLPVTTKIAWAAGCEIWGYPKFITDISFHLANNNFHGQVMVPDHQDLIVSVEGNLGWGLPFFPMSLLLYSDLDHKRFAAEVNVRGRIKVHRGRDIRLKFGQGDHVMTNNLRDLDLDTSKLIMATSTSRFQSRLNSGQIIGNAGGGYG